MIMNFEERPYSGKTFRPRPEIHLDQVAKLLIVATPWGSRDAARKVIDRMTDFLTLAREDNEATSPFERLTCLSSAANNLRIAALLANKAVYHDDNREEYHSGVELFAAQISDHEVDWIQSGNPQILLARQGRPLMPMGSQLDLSSDLSENNEILAALPSQLLGLDPTLNLTVNGFRARGGDRLVLLSHSQPPEVVYSLKEKDITIERLSKELAHVHPDVAFWLGIMQIEDESIPDAEDAPENEFGSETQEAV